MVSDNYIRSAVVNRIIDGDTVEVIIDLGFSIKIKKTVRMLGYNAPELTSSNTEERELAQIAKKCLSNLLYGKSIMLQTVKFNEDMYGRLLGIEWIETDKSINDQMLEFGVCVPYDGKGKRPIVDWSKYLVEWKTKNPV